MKSFALQLIRWYQKYPSFLNGPSVCRFTPRCSEYCYQAISKYGVIKGAGLGVQRVGRCHPWHTGGVDTVV